MGGGGGGGACRFMCQFFSLRSFLQNFMYPQCLTCLHLFQSDPLLSLSLSLSLSLCSATKTNAKGLLGNFKVTCDQSFENILSRTMDRQTDVEDTNSLRRLAPRTAGHTLTRHHAGDRWSQYTLPILHPEG